MTRLESLQADAALMQELSNRIKKGDDILKAANINARSKDVESFMEGTYVELAGGPPASALEAVILDFLRPCLLVRNNTFEVPDSDVWKARLNPYRRLMERRIPAVGRVEFRFHPRHKWGGTGWLIAENIIVTNRHVAAEFARRTNGGIAFIRNSLGATIEAQLDFKEEFNVSGTPIEIDVEQVLYLADDGHPDIAIVKIAANGFQLEPIPISTRPLKQNDVIAVIGYPAYDPFRNPLKPEDVTRIFNNIFEFKRLSPGQVMNEAVHPETFSHDATTLGGNTGSVVIDLNSGQAVGLHFSGVFHDANFAVSAASILDALANSSVQVPVVTPPLAMPAPAVDDEETLLESAQEARPEDYGDREGYAENFLGVAVWLPQINNVESVLTFGEGGQETVLKYLHFSVAMHHTRRMCIYSAVNISGQQAKKTKRPGWRLDPRIGKDQQIIKECYGNPPKFSRGHMTRREDPAWGDTLDIATLGNADSMHVTNTVPQMQPFNAGIWLGLEDYALQHARQDKMQISVFTGPFLEDSDPTQYGVQIPVEFWKVIAFIHDETGELCVTGYTMSQKSFLQREEFIFGQYETYQTPIRSIEERAGLNFGPLAGVDPYNGEELVPAPLVDFTQIVFRR